MIEDSKTQEKGNKEVDVGCLLIQDCASFDGLNDKKIIARTKKNICAIYNAMFELKKKQEAVHGDDGEILEYTKAKYNVSLPKPAVVLPREKSAPKEKVLTKWERFRLEKGMPARKKRSRMVFDPITEDWVPRHGTGSIKKIAERHNWLMEDKPKHETSGVDPFTYEKQEKKKAKEKQGLAQLKNEINAQGPVSAQKSDTKVLPAANAGETGGVGPSKMKAREDGDRADLRKREHKSLMKSLQVAQISTGSMGKFDRKVNKKEPDAPGSQKIKKKKSSASLDHLNNDRGSEKDRNLKIFNLLERKAEIKAGGGTNKAAVANTNENKIIKKAKKKEGQRRKSS